MNMTKEEKIELAGIVANAMNQNQKMIPDFAKVIDWLFKALIAILVWLGVGLNTSLKQVLSDVNQMKIESEYNAKDMEKFKSFISVPRYTKETHDIETTPLRNQLNRNTTDITTLRNLVDKNASELVDLKYIANKNAETVKDILEILKSKDK